MQWMNEKLFLTSRAAPAVLEILGSSRELARKVMAFIKYSSECLLNHGDIPPMNRTAEILNIACFQTVQFNTVTMTGSTTVPSILKMNDALMMNY